MNKNRSKLSAWALALAVINLPVAISVQLVLEIPYSAMPFPASLIFPVFSLAVLILAVLGLMSGLKRNDGTGIVIASIAVCLAGFELWCTAIYPATRAAY